MISCCPLNRCIANLLRFAAIPLPEALLTATLNPAKLLGGSIASTKGKLEVGYDADLVILDWDGSVKSTWIMGKEAYTAIDEP
jgi:N-acetylglucosamine-6-phosphate deacetylase